MRIPEIRKNSVEFQEFAKAPFFTQGYPLMLAEMGLFAPKWAFFHHVFQRKWAFFHNVFLRFCARFPESRGMAAEGTVLALRPRNLTNLTLRTSKGGRIPYHFGHPSGTNQCFFDGPLRHACMRQRPAKKAEQQDRPAPNRVGLFYDLINDQHNKQMSSRFLDPL